MLTKDDLIAFFHIKLIIKLHFSHEVQLLRNVDKKLIIEMKLKRSQLFVAVPNQCSYQVTDSFAISSSLRPLFAYILKSLLHLQRNFYQILDHRFHF